jgi:hypothetical protein
VEHHVRARLRLANRLTINCNNILFRINARSQNAHNLSVYRNSTCGYQCFTISARSNAGACQHLLQSFWTHDAIPLCN